MSTLAIGSNVKDFTFTSTHDETAKLSDFLGQPIVLYFYPKDNTSGCTKEAEDFIAHYSTFQKKKVLIFGISKDSLKSHVKFTEKYDIPFPLITDESQAICQQFDVIKEKSMYGRKYMGIERSTFLLDEQGKIQQLWRKVKVTGHVSAILDAL